jgi:hypothetical protein
MIFMEKLNQLITLFFALSPLWAAQSYDFEGSLGADPSAPKPLMRNMASDVTFLEVWYQQRVELMEDSIKKVILPIDYDYIVSDTVDEEGLPLPTAKKTYTQYDFPPKSNEEQSRLMWVRRKMSMRAGQQMEVPFVRSDFILKKMRLSKENFLNGKPLNPKGLFLRSSAEADAPTSPSNDAAALKPSTAAPTLSIFSCDTESMSIFWPSYDFKKIADDKNVNLHPMVSRFREDASPQFYEKVQSAYDNAKKALEDLNPAAQIKIAKIMHTIWLDTSPWSTEYANFFNDAKKVCAPYFGWKHILWIRDKAGTSLSSLGVDEADGVEMKEVKDLVTNDHPIWNPTQLMASGRYAAASQVLRYEILKRFGGVYRSCDTHIIRSLTPFHQVCDFYAPMDPNFLQYPRDFLLASTPNHPIIEQWLEALKGDTNVNDYTKSHVRLSLCFDEKAGQDNRLDVIMPPMVFAPSRPIVQVRSALHPEATLHEASFAMHFFDKSWVAQIKK